MPVRLEPNVKTNFPNLYRYISVDFPKLIDNRIVVEGLTYYGKMNKEKIRSCLNFGSGPKFTILENDDGNHYIDADNLYVHRLFAEMFEKDEDIIITRYGKNVHYLGVEILESLVYVNSNSQEGRRAFTKNLYGVDAANRWRKVHLNGFVPKIDEIDFGFAR
jgi:hypothetical protein